MKTTKKAGENPDGDTGKCVELELYDAFNNPYSVAALPKEKILHILKNLDLEEVVNAAYIGHTPGMETGVAELDITTGEIVSAGYSTGSGDIQGAHLIHLFSVDQNIDFPTEDLLTEEEMEGREKLETETGECLGDEEYLERIGEDVSEREIESLYEGLMQTLDELQNEEDGWFDQVDAIYCQNDTGE